MHVQLVTSCLYDALCRCGCCVGVLVHRQGLVRITIAPPTDRIERRRQASEGL